MHPPKKRITDALMSECIFDDNTLANIGSMLCPVECFSFGMAIQNLKILGYTPKKVLRKASNPNVMIVLIDELSGFFFDPTDEEFPIYSDRYPDDLTLSAEVLAVFFDSDQEEIDFEFEMDKTEYLDENADKFEIDYECGESGGPVLRLFNKTSSEVVFRDCGDGCILKEVLHLQNIELVLDTFHAENYLRMALSKQGEVLLYEYRGDGEIELINEDTQREINKFTGKLKSIADDDFGWRLFGKDGEEYRIELKNLALCGIVFSASLDYRIYNKREEDALWAMAVKS